MIGIMVVGLGSMGSRRIRILKKMLDSHQYYIMGVDNSEERRINATEKLRINTYDTIEAAFRDNEKDLQIAIVSTSPLSHAEIIKQCLNMDLHVFTELNLVDDGYQENIQLAEKKNKILFLSSTFLYRDEIDYISKMVHGCKSVAHYAYHVGQYLPDWHPWESYQNFFIGDRRTNGCREILAIELPWIQSIFGEINDIKVQKIKSTRLSIEYNDTYQILLRHNTGTLGALQIDVISPKAVRNLEVYGEDIFLSWDGTPSGLKKYDLQKKQDMMVDLYNNVEHLEGYEAFVIENAYENELHAFMNEISGVKCAKYSFNDDIEILEIIDRIES